MIASLLLVGQVLLLSGCANAIDVPIVADQSACCGELGGGAFDVAFERIARGEE